MRHVCYLVAATKSRHYLCYVFYLMLVNQRKLYKVADRSILSVFSFYVFSSLLVAEFNRLPSQS